MGLGTNNRDYKTSDRAARINLAAHKILTDKLMAEGVERKEASSRAFKELMSIPFKRRQAIIDAAAKQD